MTGNADHRFGARIEDLDWIDGFAERIRPYVRVRLEDRVLIKVPTDVYELNPEGAAMLARALEGAAAREIARETRAAGHPDRLLAIHNFFCDVRDLLSGKLGTGTGRRATRVRRFTGSITRLPVLSEFALTYRCNLACAFCYAGCGTPGVAPRAGGPELGTEDARRIVTILARDAKVPSISFTGGECTLRQDLPELVALSVGLRMRVNLITNGVRCASPAYVRGLCEAGLHSAQVSIEGPDARVHDGLTQRPGSFDRAVRGVKNLAAAGITVHIHTTISRENAARLEEIVALAKRLELPRLSMNLLIPTGTPLLPDHAGLPVPYSEVGPLVLDARRCAEEAGLAFHWYSPTPFCLFNPVASGLGNKGCAACDGLIHVAPSGDVLPCSSYPRSVGNLLRDGFEKVWAGRRAKYHRKKRHAPLVCRTCGHFALCQGACPLYWEGLGRGELYRGYGKMVIEKAMRREVIA